MIHCEALNFDYGSRPILRGVNFHVSKGELVALLGRNGAGKSTTLRLLGGLLRPVSGVIRVAGLDPSSGGVSFRRRVGLLPDGLALFEELTLEEQFVLVGRLHGLSRAECESRISELVKLLGLQDAIWASARTASHGTRKKAALAMTLLPDPEVLLLDEPFEGVDPAGARRMEGLFQAMIAKGRTILFSVHDLELVARLAPRILLLDKDGSLGGRHLEELRWQDFEGDESAVEVPSWLGSSSF